MTRRRFFAAAAALIAMPGLLAARVSRRRAVVTYRGAEFVIGRRPCLTTTTRHADGRVTARRVELDLRGRA